LLPRRYSADTWFRSKFLDGLVLRGPQNHGANPSQIAIILKPRTARSGLLSFNPEVSADLAGKLIGADAGVMVAALAQIEQTGLSLQQIKNVGSGLISYLEEANPALAKEILDKVPSLREHLT
jgi:hypothetical protein